MVRSSLLPAFPATVPSLFAIAVMLFASLWTGSSLAQEKTASLSTGHAQTQAIASLLTELGRTRAPRQVAISPNGQVLAWVVRSESSGSRIYLRRMHGTADSTRKIIVPVSDVEAAHTCSEGDVAWSPASKRIAFLSDCATPGQQQIFIADVPGNQPGRGQPAAQSDNSRPSVPLRRLTALKGFVHALAWSPDGKQLGFLYVKNATRPPDAFHAIKPRVGVISAHTIAEVQRIAVIATTTSNAGQPRLDPVTPASLYVYGFDWSPNSKRLAYVAAVPPGVDNWWVAQLYTQAVANGTPHSILKPKMQIAGPRWSPDGKQIAFIGGLMSDQGITGGDIYLISSHGGAARDITQDRKSTPARVLWIGDHRLAFIEGVDGETRYSVLNPRTGVEDKSARVTFPEDVDFSFAKNGAVGTIQSSFDTPPEIWAGPSLKNLVQITHLNGSLQPDWGRSESLIWNNQGFRIQGWLIYPKNYDPQKKYPLVVSVHGGPASLVLPHWPSVGYTPVAFSTFQYFVLMPNPRGSYGEGEAFTQANRQDFGYGDLRDILAGVDVVEKKFPIDPHRIGITGWSYGGFMTMFAITQTHRFRAAVAGAGISDWKSYYGENSIDQWMIPYFGASVYDDPAVYAKSSAINFIKNARTPTLIVVGDRDGECPAPQSFEMWRALKTMHVPVELVVYANEGHMFTSPKDRRDVLERAVRWFEKYMPPTGS